MSGIWSYSNQSINDLNGKPYVGAKAYFYDAGTTTPQDVFQDYGLGVEHPNPVEADGYGRFPAVYLDEANSFVKVRVTTRGGSLLFQQDSIPIIGPEGGGGGDPVAPVDPTALFTTGDWKGSHRTGTLAGWVRANGRTIGSATSGATERANADCRALFEHLWGQNLETQPVSGGRGASAGADWAANKTITLPDWRNRSPYGLDAMGSGSSSGRIPSGAITSSGGGPDVLGSTGGAATHTLVEAEIPTHDHNVSANQDSHSHSIPLQLGLSAATGAGTRGVDPSAGSTGTADPAITITEDAFGGGGAHNNMSPFFLTTFYLKL